MLERRERTDGDEDERVGEVVEKPVIQSGVRNAGGEVPSDVRVCAGVTEYTEVCCCSVDGRGQEADSVPCWC